MYNELTGNIESMKQDSYRSKDEDKQQIQKIIELNE